MDDSAVAYAMALHAQAAQSLHEKRPIELFDKDNVQTEMEAKKAAEAKKKSYKSLNEMYKEWLLPNVEHVRTTLHDYFGAEYEFTVTKRPSFSTWLDDHDKGSDKANTDYFKRCLRGVEQETFEWRRMTAYTIVIHLPKLTVRNSHGRRHDITDMYIKCELNPFLTDIHSYQFFRGMRTSYTLAEMTSEYNFSHLQGSPSNMSWSNFCLGHTDFSTMCRSMAIEFNQDFFTLWCQQLPDYLSWESLEGGPYKRFEGVHERGSYNTVSIDNAHKAMYYKEFLASGHTPVFEVKANPFYYTLSVVEDDDLRKAITKVVKNDNHLQFWDNERKVSSDRSVTNRASMIEDYKRSHRGPIMQFNGKDVMFAITDAPVKEEKDDKVKVAHQSIVGHIVNSLNKSVLKTIKNEFNNKRRRYVAG